MPVHDSLAREYESQAPFDGLTVAVASHLEATTGVFVETLHRADARSHSR
jgi:adenosylhomocysteinase